MHKVISSTVLMLKRLFNEQFFLPLEFRDTARVNLDYLSFRL